MAQVDKAEQLRLPEQLYILLVDPDIGRPKYPAQRVERVLATAIVWELMHENAFDTTGNTINKVQQVMFQEAYMRKASLICAARTPIGGHDLIMAVAAEMHPIWQTIGRDMVAKHLLTEEVRKRFMVFHRRVFMELGDARRDAQELSKNLTEAARNLWDPQYDDELARTHPRLLARIVLLENHRLLQPILGAAAYVAAAPHISEIRTHLHELVGAQSSQQFAATASRADSGGFWSGGDSGTYSSGTDFWFDTYDYGGGGDGFGGHGHDGHGHDGDGHGDGDGSDGGGSDGGGGGGDGGCGGCGGCGG